jgi:hypothetical protein
MTVINRASSAWQYSQLSVAVEPAQHGSCAAFRIATGMMAW